MVFKESVIKEVLVGCGAGVCPSSPAFTPRRFSHLWHLAGVAHTGHGSVSWQRHFANLSPREYCKIRKFAKIYPREFNWFHSMLYRLWDGEIQGHTGQPSVREIDVHTMYNEWATTPCQNLNYPKPKFIIHLSTFNDIGVYVALQVMLVIVGSDLWRQVLIPYSYWQTPWVLLHALGWLSRYT